MPYYRILVHADGLNIPMARLNELDSFAGFVDVDEAQGRSNTSSATEAISGFVTTRVVKARSVEAAREAVVELIFKEWATGPYAKLNARPGQVRIESVEQIGFLNAVLARRPAGCTFY